MKDINVKEREVIALALETRAMFISCIWDVEEHRCCFGFRRQTAVRSHYDDNLRTARLRYACWSSLSCRISTSLHIKQLRY